MLSHLQNQNHSILDELTKKSGKLEDSTDTANSFSKTGNSFPGVRQVYFTRLSPAQSQCFLRRGNSQR